MANKNMKKLKLEDIAKKLNLSKATISRAVNPQTRDLIKKDTLIKIDKFIKKYNYVPNRSAQMLSTQKSNTIGLLIQFDPDVFLSGYMIDLLAGVVDELRKTNYDLKIIPIDVAKDSCDMDNIFASNALDGMVVLNWRVYKDIAERLKTGLDKNIILINDYYKGIKANILYFDGQDSGYKATEYLINKGCRKIAHLKGSLGSYDVEGRLKGYNKALDVYKLKKDKNLVVTAHFDEKQAYQHVKTLLSKYKKIDGIFCSNDGMAISAIKALKDLGIKCPDQVKVIGCDGIKLGEHLTPSLTTVSGNLQKIGRLAVEKLLGILKESKNKKFNYIKEKYDTSIIERESV
jgi:LacI family transcriptional regulator